MDNQDQVFELDITLLQPNPLQPRGLITPESLAELADSIRAHGILLPLVIAKTPAGFQIIAGERRWRAARLVGLKKVPVVIKETTPQGMLEMAIVENVQRQDLNPLERAQAYKRLMDEFGLNNGDISQRVGKSPSYISNTIRLLSLPDALKDGLMSGQTTEGHVRALAALDDPHLIVEAYKEVLKKNLSVRATEDLTRRMKSRHNMPRRNVNSDTMHILNDEIDEIQARLASTLTRSEKKTAVKYILTGNQAMLEIRIPGDPQYTSETVKKIYQAISTHFNSEEQL